MDTYLLFGFGLHLVMCCFNFHVWFECWLNTILFPVLPFIFMGVSVLAREEYKTVRASQIASCWMEYLLTKHSLDNSGFLNIPCYTHKLNVNFTNVTFMSCSVKLVYHYNEEYMGKWYKSFKLHCCGMYRDLLKNLIPKKAHWRKWKSRWRHIHVQESMKLLPDYRSRCSFCR